MTRASSIESKRILMVIVQVFTAHSILGASRSTRLQQGSHPVVGLEADWLEPARKSYSCRSAKLLADVPFPAVDVDRAVSTASWMKALLLGGCASYGSFLFFLGGDGYQCCVCRPAVPRAPHIGLVNLHATAEPFSAGPHHRAPQLVQQRPGGTASQRCFAVPSALAPFFWLVTHHMVRNQVRSGRRVSWKIVPAVTEA